PIIMLTSRSSNKHRILAMQLGATSYFTKPYLEQEFLTAIKEIISSCWLLVIGYLLLVVCHSLFPIPYFYLCVPLWKPLGTSALKKNNTPIETK
ncbi:MAG TPA: hypothetical protein DD000_15935, partial [Cyanobacteria bacterium UBA11166]|nr:hypothetical protein [Cyanobacteria bacterium UBA11166]